MTNIYITGFFTDTVDFDADTSGIFNLPVFNSNAGNFITKLDSSGKFIWAKEMGTFVSGKKSFLALDRNANIYVSAVYDSASDIDPGIGIINLIDQGLGDICVVQLDSSGSLRWAKQVGGIRIENIDCPVTVDYSFSVYLTGRFSSDSISCDTIIFEYRFQRIL